MTTTDPIPPAAASPPDPRDADVASPVLDVVDRLAFTYRGRLDVADIGEVVLQARADLAGAPRVSQVALVERLAALRLAVATGQSPVAGLETIADSQ